MTIMMMMDSSAALHLNLLTLTVMFCFSLLCGFSPGFFMRQAARYTSDPGSRLRALSLASCLSSGVFLGFSLLDLLPKYLTDMRDTFSRLDITLRFPLSEFLLAMGVLLVLLVEQMLLAFSEQVCVSSVEKQTLIERTRLYVEDSRTHEALRVCLLLLCVCVRSLLEGVCAAPPPLWSCGAALLREGLLAFGLALRLAPAGLRRAVATGGLVLFCSARPVAMGTAMLRGTPGDQAYTADVVRCAVEGLTCGIFICISISGLLFPESSSPKQRMHKVAFLLTGFALVTAVLISQV